MKDIKRVIYITTNSPGGGCELCRNVEPVWRFDAAVNHYLTQHSCVLLHVGEETDHDSSGKGLWHSTVATVGVK